MTPGRAPPVVVSTRRAGRERQLGLLEPRVAEVIREVLSYPADTAGALMDPRITGFGPDTTVNETLQKMRTFPEKDLGAIYLTDAGGRLVGFVPLREIATPLPETQM